MNQTSNYIFNLYIYLLNARDTLEYTITRQHLVETYENRKKVLESAFDEKSALGNFLKNNPEQAENINKNLHEFVDALYGEESNILKVKENEISVDHTQHVEILEKTVGVTETIRDIIYGYLNFARQQNQTEDLIVKLIEADDRFYRILSTSLVLRDFEKSFAEFQKVMSESQGKPTPQSNFIVQNEIMKMSSMLRFIRQHRHITDNETLDLLDEVEQLIEMTEGRRDRRNNAPFKDFFEGLHKKLGEKIGVLEAAWKATFEAVLQEVKKPAANAQA